jgi:hypothetical protein
VHTIGIRGRRKCWVGIRDGGNGCSGTEWSDCEEMIGASAAADEGEETAEIRKGSGGGSRRWHRENGCDL